MFIGQSIGTVSLGQLALSPPRDTAEVSWIFGDEEIPYPFGLSFEPAFRLEDGTVELAHWFLILLFLVPWLSFLFWRVRKQVP